MTTGDWQNWAATNGRLTIPPEDRLRFFAPHKRGYFLAWRKWLEDRLAGRDTPPPPKNVFTANTSLSGAARLHAQIALKKAENLHRRLALSTRDTTRIGEECGLPVGLALDLEQELHPEVSADRPAPSNVIHGHYGHYLAGAVRGWRLEPQRVVVVPILLVLRVENQPHPFAAQLLFEWIPKGRGEFYAHPAFAFVDRDEAWLTGEKGACDFLKSNGCWPKDADIRWRLLLPKPPHDSYGLQGGSAGAAFALGMLRLVALVSPGLKVPIPKIRQFKDLLRFAVSATFREDGTLGEVADHFEKIVGANRFAVPAIHWLVTSPQNQTASPSQAEPDQQPASTQGFVTRRESAVTLAEVVERMAVRQENNWADFPLADLPRYNVPRRKFLEQVEHWVRETAAGYLVLWGGMGMGKTTAMLQLVHARRALGQDPIYHFLNMSGSDTPQAVAWSLFQQLRRKYPQWAPEKTDPINAVPLLDGLLQRISAEGLKCRPGEKEVLFIDAADQVDMGSDASPSKLDSFISGALRHLPEGVLCIVSSRYATTAGPQDWFQFSRQMEPRQFQDCVDDRQDIEEYLAQHAPDLSASLRSQIVSAREPPNFYAVAQRLRTLERQEAGLRRLQEELRGEAKLWLVAPEELVEEELGRIVRRATRGRVPVPPQKAWRVLYRLALAGGALNEPQWKALGFLDAAMQKVLRLAANLFAWRPAQAPLLPYAFDHPGIPRAILHNPMNGSPRCNVAEIHAEFAKACAGSWRGEANPARDYALYSLPNQLFKAGQLEKLAEQLCDVEFLQAKITQNPYSNQPVCDLLRDFSDARAALMKASQWGECINALEAIQRVLDRRASCLSEFPKGLFQELWNELSWGWGPTTSLGRNLREFQKRFRNLWLRRLNRPPCTALLREMDHGWKVFSLTISPVAGKDGTRWLASGGGFKVRLWDPETGANKTPPSLRRHLEEVELNVKRVEWLDSQHLIIGFEDTTPLVWNVQTDQRLTPAEYATIKEQTVGLNRSDIQKRELPGAIRQQLEALTEERGRENYVLGSDCLTSVAWLDSRRVATAHYDGRVRIWDSEAAKEITPAGLIGHGYGRTEVVWLNSRRLASGGGDQWVRIWHIDAERNQTFEGFAEQEDSAPKGITVASLEEDLLATIGGEDFPGPDGSVRIWGTKTGQDRTPMGFNMHRPRASALAQLDAQIVAIGYENGRVEIRDLKTGNNVTSPTLNGHSCGNAWFGFPGTREVTALSWLHASQLASGTMDGKVKIWDTLKGDVTPPKLAARHAEFGLYGLEWLDSHRLVIVGNEDVEIWDLTADQGYTPAGSVGRGDLSTPFSRLQKGRIACIGWYGRVKILDTEWLGDITPTVFSREPDRRVMALTGVGEHLLATLDEQHWLQIWDVDCERTIASTIVHDARSMRFDTVRRELQVFTACETGRLMSVQFSLPGF